MITGLPANFVTELEKTSRKPVQLLHFITSTAIYYLADKEVGVSDGLANEYQPWIESWGTLRDNANINAVFRGDALEARAGTITLINSPASLTFIQELLAYGIENAYVELYQWFDGLLDSEKVLIDTMICQDPINIIEASMLVSIDLVSVVMINNPYLWGREVGSVAYDIVIGKAIGVPIIDLQSARKTTLVEDLPVYEEDGMTIKVGPVTIANGIGFPASGLVWIDSELLAYDSINATQINITHRGVSGTTVRPHYSSALITIPDAWYDYAICAGPVTAIDNPTGYGEAFVDGIPYTAPISYFPGQDPAMVSFYGRPPWLQTKTFASNPQQPVDRYSTQYGQDIEGAWDSRVTEPVTISAVNRFSGACSMEMEYDTNALVSTVTLTSPTPAHMNQFATDPNPTVDASKLYYHGQGIIELRVPPFNRTSVSSTGLYMYGRDDSALGTLNLVTVTIDFGDSFVKDVRMRYQVYFTSESYYAGPIYSEQEIDYTTGGGPTNFGISNTTLTFDVTSFVGGDDFDFATLADYGVFIFVDCFDTDEGTPDTSQIQVKSVKIDAYYTPVGAGIPNVWQVAQSHYNRDSSDLGGLVSVDVYVKAGSVATHDSSVQIISQEGSYTGSSTILDTLPIAPSQEYGPYTIYPSDWVALNNLRVGVYQIIDSVVGIGEVAALSTQVDWVRWVIRYTPGLVDIPDEERVIYAEKLTVDVTSPLGVDPTPAQAIRWVIEDHSPNAYYIDETEFDARHAEYVTDGYYFNGMIDGKIRLHGALKQFLKEGAARLLFNQGRIKLLNYVTENDPVIDLDITQDDILLRSKSIKNQPTNIIKNDFTIYYGKDLTEGSGYRGVTQRVDDLSITRYTRKEEILYYDLVDRASTAEYITFNLLKFYKDPVSVVMFRAFMPVGYVLEKGDKVTIPSFLDATLLEGNVVSSTRTFGQGKTDLINSYDIEFVNYPQDIPEEPVVLFEGAFIYVIDSNPPTSPGDGNFAQSDTFPEYLRVSGEYSDGSDAMTDLRTLVPGNAITGAGPTWVIESTEDQGTYMQFFISSTDLGSPEGLTTFTFLEAAVAGGPQGYGSPVYGVAGYGS